jgi:glycosyltransferase involved in cell wall biosynthesis
LVSEQHIPRVSLGLPVYNGQRFLCQALDSILAQSFTDFELIISDNASTDSTPDICRAYAASDARISYFRSESNRGVVWNHNQVFEHSIGEFFKWCGADDLMDPRYISSCLSCLETLPNAVLCYSNAVLIDDQGIPVECECNGEYSCELPLDSTDIVVRFSSLLSPFHRRIVPFHGIIRSAALRRIGPLGDFLASDRCLLAELSLLGPFLRVSETLFYRRTDTEVSNENKEIFLYNPSRPSCFVVREWRVVFKHLRSIRRARVSGSVKLKLLRAWYRWIVVTRSAFGNEAKEFTKQMLRQWKNHLFLSTD